MLLVSTTDVEVIRNARRALMEIRDRSIGIRSSQEMAVMLAAHHASDALFAFLLDAKHWGDQDIGDLHRTAVR